MKTIFMNVVTTVLLGFLITSCGRSSDSNNTSLSGAEEEQAEENQVPATVDGSNIQGRYLAKFTTLNSHVVGTIPGSAQFLREDNQLSAFVRLFAGSPSIAHFQNVHSGSRCPTLDDDTNGDGFLDIQETMNVVGPVIIPLDWDIGSQLSANRSWPKAFPNGSYEYTQVTSFNRFWNDLTSEDRNTEDNIAKIAPDEGFSFEGKVVIIQGVDETKTLPETVAGFQQWKNFQTLPIACGIFTPYTEDPGVVYQEESIPGPVAPVEEGQDRPAGPGEGEDPGTGEVITGGPSNETSSGESSGTNTGSETEENETGRPERPREPETDTSPIPEPTPEPEPEPEEDEGICWPWETECRS